MLSTTLQKWAAAAACAGILISPLAAAAAPGQGRPIDVALHDGGLLIGQVVDAQGTPAAGAEVAIRTAGEQPIRVRTDQHGQYSVAGLRGGVYEITAARSAGVYRLWAPQTAPPAASQGLMLVASDDVVRGQYHPTYAPAPGPFATAMGWIAEHPLLTTLGVASAVVIPLSINDTDPAS